GGGGGGGRRGGGGGGEGSQERSIGTPSEDVSGIRGASGEGRPGRFIVSLDLEKRSVELVVAEGDGAQQLPDLLLPASPLLAMGQLLPRAPIMPGGLLHRAQEVPLQLWCHHLR